MTLEGQGGVCFASPRIYVRDGTSGNIYTGYNGSVITSVNTTDVSIVDYYGETQTFRVVTGIERKSVLHGIVHG